MEYLKLATLGSKVWDYRQFKEICDSLLLAAEKSHSPDERTFAYMLAAHLNFKYKSQVGSLTPTHDYCTKAADLVERQSKHSEKDFYLARFTPIGRYMRSIGDWRQRHRPKRREPRRRF